MNHICQRCGAEFEYSGNVKRCLACRHTCEKCGAEVSHRGNLCHRCRIIKRAKVKCRYPECNVMIRSNPKRNGYCRKHTDWSNHAKRMSEFNHLTKTKPQNMKYRTEEIPSIPRICIVCGHDFLATPASIKIGGGIVCGRKCQGVRAAQLTPKTETDIEKIMEDAFISNGINFKKQIPLYGITVADFLIPSLNAIIYCDGEFWHRLPARRRTDGYQNMILRAKGYKVFRFPGAKIHKSVETCIQEIINNG